MIERIIPIKVPTTISNNCQIILPVSVSGDGIFGISNQSKTIGKVIRKTITFTNLKLASSLPFIRIKEAKQRIKVTAKINSILPILGEIR